MAQCSGVILASPSVGSKEDHRSLTEDAGRSRTINLKGILKRVRDAGCVLRGSTVTRRPKRYGAMRFGSSKFRY
ncbi:hypothetical protein J6590_033368 [Homalodisca vitripennis]|nr:hypothetical protein J6590_033368 [Homalodisca vitripennis]